MDYPWYDDVPPGTSIEQGDIIEKCALIIPNENHYKAIIDKNENVEPLDIKEINGIVLSQSCDITNNKIDSIIICPIWPLRKLIESNDIFKDSKGRGKEELRQGKFPEYHLLQKFKTPESPMDYYFVDFHHIYSVPKRFVEALLKNKSHKRLLPPYKEHLSQSFARYFMRVGLPVDIPRDEIKNYDRC